MPIGTRTTSFGRLAGVAVAGAIAVTACGGSGTPRPTDPHRILVDALAATAALPTVRIHVELGSTVSDVGVAPGNGRTQLALDADVDLATRQLAGRQTTRFPANQVGNGGGPAQQVSDFIVTTTATFSRDGTTGRWSKNSTSGFGGGPTNAQVATMLGNLLSNPALTFELRDAASCTLGTCDHVVAHVDGRALGAALGPLLGVPLDSTTSTTIPDFDLDVLVDQATSVVSEVRTQIVSGGQTVQILLTLANPGQPIQIVPPPPALTDDFGANFGGGGVVTLTPEPMESILVDVGNELETPLPSMAEDQPSSP